MPYSLKELTLLARQKTKGLTIDKHKIRCAVFPCPDPKCKADTTHIHLGIHHDPYGGIITLEAEELFLPKYLQNWLISHEVAHLHDDGRHGSKSLRDIESKLCNYDSQTLRLDYKQYCLDHDGELKRKARKYYMTRKR